MYISLQFTFIFLKAKVKTLVNTATIQWIHSTTKYHEAKVMMTKNKRYMYILFQKYPNRENKENIHPICQPPRNPGFHFLFNLVGQ